MAAAASRDESRFDDPDVFDIRRNGANHCPSAVERISAWAPRWPGWRADVALEEHPQARWPDWTVDLDNAVRAPTATVRGWDSMP